MTVVSLVVELFITVVSMDEMPGFGLVTEVTTGVTEDDSVSLS